MISMREAKEKWADKFRKAGGYKWTIIGRIKYPAPTRGGREELDGV